jgi:protein SCO1/2
MQKKIGMGLLMAAVFALIFFSGSRTSHRPSAPEPSAINAAFTLTATDAKPVRDTDFRGRPMLVFMGYTHCPDICPQTVFAMGKALALLGPDAKRVAALFITLDPTRDTPAVLAAWLAHFPPGVIGLTGSDAAIHEAIEHYRVYASHGRTGSDPLDHSGTVYLIDAQGRFVRPLDPAATPDAMAQALKETLQSASH